MTQRRSGADKPKNGKAMKLHSKENNSESQSFLDENKDRISRNCLKTYELLRRGKRLTTDNAPSYGIRSLPRRIKDLRDHNGIHIDEQWLTDADGKKICKEWFINQVTQKQFNAKTKKAEITTNQAALFVEEKAD